VNDLNIESFGHAVHLSNSKGCSLLDNRLADNIFSIWIEDSQDNRIAGNTINRTSRDGISLYRSSGNVVSNSSLRLTGGFGMISMYGFNNTIADNKIRDSTGEDGIQLSGTSNNHVVNNNVDTTFFYGIELASASHNVVSANSVRNGTQGVAGIHLYNSTDNILQGNNITDNGVGFEFSFHSNTNIITENTIENNSIFGMTFSFSSGNVLFHNNFLNNTQQVSTQGVSNTWDNGYPSGGNYWSDYNGSDTYGGTGQNISGSDGIGDTPYVVFGEVEDHYPLMTPFVVPEFSFSALILTLVLTTLSAGIAWRKRIHAISRCSG
jgi:parallel beta-helix repeat protein